MFKIKPTFALLLSLLCMQGMKAENTQWVNPKPTGQVMHDIVFFDANHGLMCGEQGTLLTSSDGGNMWLETQQGNRANYQQIEAVANGIAWIRAGDHLLKTNDFGTTFSMTGQLPAGYSYKAISMFSPTEGYALRYNSALSQPNELGYTTKGGNTWTWISFPPEIKDVLDLRFSDALQ
ncbi:MAG: WD40/YVTN/BNR-like repeat-containing protein [Bacteroidales bacterium]